MKPLLDEIQELLPESYTIGQVIRTGELQESEDMARELLRSTLEFNWGYEPIGTWDRFSRLGQEISLPTFVYVFWNENLSHPNHSNLIQTVRDAIHGL